MLHGLSSNIILADDDDDDCLLFHDIVRELFPEVKVTRAVNGKELLGLLQNDISNSTDIIFLDVNMPITNGLEALAKIRTIDALKSIPIIMLSTSAHARTVEEAFGLRANYFVKKPDSPAKLANILKELLTMDWGSTSRPSRSDFLFSC